MPTILKKSTSFIMFLLFTNVFGMQQPKTHEEINAHNKKVINALLTENRFTSKDGLSMALGAGNIDRGQTKDYSRFVGSYDVTATSVSGIVDFEKTDLLSLVLNFNEPTFKKITEPLRGRLKKIIFDYSVVKFIQDANDLIMYLIDLLAPGGTLTFDMEGRGGMATQIDDETFNKKKENVMRMPNSLYIDAFSIPMIKRLTADQIEKDRLQALVDELYETYAKNNIDYLTQRGDSSVDYFNDQYYPIPFIEKKFPYYTKAKYFVVTKKITVANTLTALQRKLTNLQRSFETLGEKLTALKEKFKAG